MKKSEVNFAFVDAQNLHRGINSLGWNIDWYKFRIYLTEKYSVKLAYVFIGFVQENQGLYEYLQRCGYVLVFKPIVRDGNDRIKGNCDADLVLHSILKISEYDKAVIVTSDGDFYSLVRHLREQDKLAMVLSSYVKTCSKLLKKEAREKINYMDNLRRKIGKNENAPHKDGTL